MKTLSGFKAIALINPANNDTVVLNRIGAESTYTPEITQTETTDGVIEGGGSHSLDVTFYDSDSAKIAQLRAWESVDTPIIAVVWGLQGNLIWNEPTTIQALRLLNPNARDGVSANSFSMVTFVPDARIKKGVNISKAVMWRNDAGTYAVPQLLGSSVTDYGANITGIDTSANLTFRFPFEGSRVTIAFDANTNIDSATIEVLSAVGATLLQEAITGSGRSSATITLPAGAYSLSLDIVSFTNTTINNLSIRVDGSTLFTRA